MTLGELFLLRKWRMVPRHNISTILVESVFGGILWGKECPQTPEETPKGAFDFPLGLSLETTKGQGLRPLPFGNPPKPFS